MTKGRKVGAQPLPGVLNTTISFQPALAKARELCRNEPDSEVAVHHLLRIDRRA
jgi:hypothetical protein